MATASKKKITVSDVRLEVLSEIHMEKMKTFKSYEQDLVDYLLEDALNHQKNKVAQTYLVFHRGTNNLLAYITFTNDCVKLEKIKPELKKKLRLKGIGYKSLPALKIARICVNDNSVRNGLGSLLIQFAIHTVSQISKLSGCRFIILDAKRNSDPQNDAIHFYKKKGFEILKERNRRETPLYLDTYPYLEELNK